MRPLSANRRCLGQAEEAEWKVLIRGREARGKQFPLLCPRRARAGIRAACLPAKVGGLEEQPNLLLLFPRWKLEAHPRPNRPSYIPRVHGPPGEIRRVPFESYAPVRRQLLNILRAVGLLGCSGFGLRWDSLNQLGFDLFHQDPVESAVSDFHLSDPFHDVLDALVLVAESEFKVGPESLLDQSAFRRGEAFFGLVSDE